jgi:hypothetical protein
MIEKTSSYRKVCTNCVLNDSFPRIRFNEKGVCSVCQDYSQSFGDWQLKRHERQKILEKICKQAKGKQREFDALVPLSGGKDSTYVLYMAEKLGLNCLTYTLDIGYLSSYARNNIDRACKKLGLEHIYYSFDPDLINDLFSLFIKKTGWFCSVCMRAIQLSTFKIAEMYNIPLVIKGTSLRTELPLSREMFQGGDPAHITSVLKGESIANNCKRLLSRGASFKREVGQLLFLLSGQKSLLSHAYLNMADYVNWDYAFIQDTIKKELGWESPTESEHMDCIIHPIQKYIHNRRFPDLEIIKLTYSRLIMAGLMTREDALHDLENHPVDNCPEEILNLFLRNVGMTKMQFDNYIDLGPRHLNYHPQPSVGLKIAKKLLSMKDAGNY